MRWQNMGYLHGVLHVGLDVLLWLLRVGEWMRWVRGRLRRDLVRKVVGLGWDWDVGLRLTGMDDGVMFRK